LSTALLALGANLGDRMGALRSAVAALGDAVQEVSGAYESPPWGDDQEQPAFLNAVVLVSGDKDWLAVAQSLEQNAARVRDPERPHGPRTLDVDVIMVWDPEPVVSQEGSFTLPHPRAHLRAFVLLPWLELQPRAELPGHGPIADLLKADALAEDAHHTIRVGTLAP
jgi:2-amino-4-hydroxy-6-hydroxymethyldihydropteridine diphosphokinase